MGDPHDCAGTFRCTNPGCAQLYCLSCTGEKLGCPTCGTPLGRRSEAPRFAGLAFGVLLSGASIFGSVAPDTLDAKRPPDPFKDVVQKVYRVWAEPHNQDFSAATSLTNTGSTTVISSD